MPLLSSLPGVTFDVPPLGFGCCPMGGHGWGAVDDSQLRRAVGTALELGVRFFDTADIYGFGASERILGEALAGHREQAIIATKFGVRRNNGQSFLDTSVGWIRAALDGSLQRLGVDCIDLYQMHYWDGTTPMDDIVETLESLMKFGKIRAYGVTNHDPLDPGFRHHGSRLASFSYHFSLVHREYEARILAIQRQTDLVFTSWGSLGQGVLSGKYHSLDQLNPEDRRLRPIYANFHGDQFVAIQRLLQGMRVIAREAGDRTLTQLALRWIIDYVPRSMPLVGIKKPEQIIEAAAVLRFKLEPFLCARLDTLTKEFGVSGAI